MLVNIIDPAQKIPISIHRLTKLVCGPAKEPSLFKGLEAQSLQFETLERLPILIESPELHLAELRSDYVIMASEARRICELASQFARSCGSFDPACPVSGLKTYFMCEGINMMLLSLACILNKILREARPDDTALTADFVFLTSECVEAVTRSEPFRPLGCSLSPLCLIILRATTDSEAGWPSLIGRTELSKDPLSTKFRGLGSLLEAKLRDVEKTFAQLRGEVSTEKMQRGLEHEPIDPKVQCTIL